MVIPDIIFTDFNRYNVVYFHGHYYSRKGPQRESNARDYDVRQGTYLRST